MSKLMLWILLATWFCLVAFSPPSEQLGEKTLTWTRVAANAGDRTVVMSKSETVSLLGEAEFQPTSTEFVRIADRYPFGNPGEQLVWLYEYSRIIAEHPKTGQSLSLAVTIALENESRHIVTAFTPRREEKWVGSVIPLANLEEKAQTQGWIASPLREEELRSTIPEVLTALWRRFGINPAEAGEIILRPRRVRFLHPVRRVGDSLEVIPDPVTVWIVQVNGTLVLERSNMGKKQRLTTLIAQFTDGSLEYLPSLILP